MSSKVRHITEVDSVDLHLEPLRRTANRVDRFEPDNTSANVVRVHAPLGYKMRIGVSRPPRRAAMDRWGQRAQVTQQRGPGGIATAAMGSKQCSPGAQAKPAVDNRSSDLADSRRECPPAARGWQAYRRRSGSPTSIRPDREGPSSMATCEASESTTPVDVVAVEIQALVPWEVGVLQHVQRSNGRQIIQ